MYRRQRPASDPLLKTSLSEEVQFFLGHPGGPFFKDRDQGWWSIFKGMPEEGETLLEAAKREFFEETGLVPAPPFTPLESIKQKGGKTVWAWAFEGAWEEAQGITCNTMRLEWPYKSGKWQSYPEVDEARWFSYQQACQYINGAQLPFLDRLLAHLQQQS